MITYDNFHHTRLKLNENGFVDIQLIQLFSRNNWYLNVSNHLEVKIDRSINQLSITRANEITIQSAHKKHIYPYIPKLLLPYSYHYRIYHHHHHYYNHSYLSHCQLHIVMIFVVGDNIEGRRKVVTNITYQPQ